MAESVLWVNYDADHMKTRPHRNRIFHHIQKNYRPQYKQEKAKALRVSAQLPGSARPQSQCGCFDEDQTSSRQRAKLPLAKLKGNSDPFNALPLRIDAEENRIVAFYRDYMLPAAYNVDSIITRKILANAHAKADWELCTGGLHDRGTALAFIASNATLVAIAANAPSLQAKSLKLRSRSMADLREKLNTTPNSSPSIWWHIDMLWVAENAANNADAAQIHGTTLARLMKEYFEAGGSLFTVLEEMKSRRVLELMLFFMYADINMATQFLVRPCFDVYEWLPKVWAPFLQRVQAVMLPTPEQPYPLDPIIDSEELVWCFDVCREITARWRARKTIKVPETIASMVMAQGQYKWDVCLGKLVHRYCTHHEQCKIASKPAQWDYAQQYLSLCAIRWSRSEVQNDAYGRNLWVGKVMDTLQSVLSRSACRVGGTTWSKWQNARLWSFYIGAIYEVRRSTGYNEWHSGWFNKRFIRQAMAMNVRTWSAASEILSKFLFDPAAHDKESRWFNEAMEFLSTMRDDIELDGML